MLRTNLVIAKQGDNMLTSTAQVGGCVEACASTARISALLARAPQSACVLAYEVGEDAHRLVKLARAYRLAVVHRQSAHKVLSSIRKLSVKYGLVVHKGKGKARGNLSVEVLANPELARTPASRIIPLA